MNSSEQKKYFMYIIIKVFKSKLQKNIFITFYIFLIKVNYFPKKRGRKSVYKVYSQRK